MSNSPRVATSNDVATAELVAALLNFAADSGGLLARLSVIREGIEEIIGERDDDRR
jgi:hypothetical protein